MFRSVKYIIDLRFLLASCN